MREDAVWHVEVAVGLKVALQSPSIVFGEAAKLVGNSGPRHYEHIKKGRPAVAVAPRNEGPRRKVSAGS